ncbi:MAG: hypothetical protein HY814_14705 [Candidatus Riflebacteria bacterium]|nr:hypothetical protein [Candidatus Riflebacteria bacterium]
MPLSRGSSRLGASAAVITLLGLLFVPAPALAGPLVLEVWPCPLNADVSYALTPTSTGSAVAIDVEFDGSTRLESGYDFLHVADSMGRPVAGSPFTGSSLAGRTVRVGGPRAVLRLTTDGSDPPGLLHGFGVVSVTAVQPPASVAISTATTLPSGRVGTVYRQQLEASGTPPFTWSFLDSSPPVPGLTLTANGFLVGVPTVSGTYSFWVKADSDSQNAGVRQLSLFVKPEFGTSPVTAFDSPTSGELPVRLAVRGLDAPLREVLAILAFDPVLFDRSTSSRLAGAQDSQLYSALVGQGALMHLLTGRVAPAGGNDVELVCTLFHIAAPPLPAVAPRIWSSRRWSGWRPNSERCSSCCLRRPILASTSG